jgi:hypothetical protein
VVTERPPLPYPVALLALAGCFANTVRLLWQRRMHLPRGRAGTRVRFADVPGLRRDVLLDGPDVLAGAAANGAAWWRLAGAA